VVITILPSVYIAVRLIDKSVFESNVQRFVENEFRFDGTAVLESSSTYSFHSKKHPCTVTLMLWGEPLAESTLENIRGKMPFYDLDETLLTINQATGQSSEVDLTSLQRGYAQVLDEKNRQIADLERELSAAAHSASEAVSPQTVAEFRAVAPPVERVSISHHPVWGADGTCTDTMLVCIVKPVATQTLSPEELARIEKWLAVKHKTENVRIYVEE
jgi:hypothetical protein